MHIKNNFHGDLIDVKQSLEEQKKINQLKNLYTNLEEKNRRIQSKGNILRHSYFKIIINYRLLRRI